MYIKKKKAWTKALTFFTLGTHLAFSWEWHILSCRKSFGESGVGLEGHLPPDPPQSGAHAAEKLRPLRNHPAGARAGLFFLSFFFFWASIMKWGLGCAGLAGMARPAEKLSTAQSAVLMAIGLIWSRHALVIIPKNWSPFAVNFFVGATGASQLSHNWRFNQEPKANANKWKSSWSSQQPRCSHNPWDPVWFVIYYWWGYALYANNWNTFF